jgi:O-antigen ligase
MHVAPIVSTSPSWLQRAIEGGWLVAAGLVLLAIMPESFMQGFIQMPKVFVLRTVAIYLGVLVTLEAALAIRAPRIAGQHDGGWDWRRVWREPGGWVVVGAGAVLASNLVTLLFAPVKSIAVFGIDPGWDTYGLFNVGAYLLIFGVMLTHLRTRRQVYRLIWTISIASVLVSLLAFFQHFGLDPFRPGVGPQERAGGTFGNPIFLGSVLVMTMPLSLALFLSHRAKMSLPGQLWIGGLLLALPITGMLFSLSRGPWVASIIAALTFGALLVWIKGRALLTRVAAMAAFALAVGMVFVALPVVGSEKTSGEALTERIGSFGQTAGGLANRFIIWRTAAKVYFTVPWVDTQEYPEVPPLSPRILRPVVGYGQDMFGYAYPQGRESTYTFELASHGHNFIAHTALELGLLGVLAYTGLIAALLFTLRKLLLTARSGAYPEWMSLLLIGLSASLVGRIVEQIPGKAQVSDLMLSWMLAAVVVALARMRFVEAEPAHAPAQSTEQGRRTGGSRSARRQRAGGPAISGATLALAGTGAFAIVALVFWNTAVLTPVRGAIAMGSTAHEQADLAAARQTGDVNQVARAMDRLIDATIDAVETDGSSAIARMALGQALFDRALIEGSNTVRTRQLEQAYLQAQAVLERNPLDQRAWSRAGEFRRELAVSDRGSASIALYDSQVLVALLPGFWQAYTSLAWAYLRLEDPENSLEQLVLAKELAVASSNRPELWLLYYVEALALDALGRSDEAIAAARQSIAQLRNAYAMQFLIDRGITPPAS